MTDSSQPSDTIGTLQTENNMLRARVADCETVTSKTLQELFEAFHVMHCKRAVNAIRDTFPNGVLVKDE